MFSMNRNGVKDAKRLLRKEYEHRNGNLRVKLKRLGDDNDMSGCSFFAVTPPSMVPENTNEPQQNGNASTCERKSFLVCAFKVEENNDLLEQSERTLTGSSTPDKQQFITDALTQMDTINNFVLNNNANETNDSNPYGNYANEPEQDNPDKEDKADKAEPYCGGSVCPSINDNCDRSTADMPPKQEEMDVVPEVDAMRLSNACCSPCLEAKQEQSLWSNTCPPSVPVNGLESLLAAVPERKGDIMPIVLDDSMLNPLHQQQQQQEPQQPDAEEPTPNCSNTKLKVNNSLKGPFTKRNFPNLELLRVIQPIRVIPYIVSTPKMDYFSMVNFPMGSWDGENDPENAATTFTATVPENVVDSVENASNDIDQTQPITPNCAPIVDCENAAPISGAEAAASSMPPDYSCTATTKKCSMSDLLPKSSAKDVERSTNDNSNSRLGESLLPLSDLTTEIPGPSSIDTSTKSSVKNTKRSNKKLMKSSKRIRPRLNESLNQFGTELPAASPVLISTKSSVQDIKRSTKSLMRSIKTVRSRRGGGSSLPATKLTTELPASTTVDLPANSYKTNVSRSNSSSKNSINANSPKMCEPSLPFKESGAELPVSSAVDMPTKNCGKDDKRSSHCLIKSTKICSPRLSGSSLSLNSSSTHIPRCQQTVPPEQHVEKSAPIRRPNSFELRKKARYTFKKPSPLDTTNGPSSSDDELKSHNIGPCYAATSISQQNCSASHALNAHKVREYSYGRDPYSLTKPKKQLGQRWEYAKVSPILANPTSVADGVTKDSHKSKREPMTGPYISSLHTSTATTDVRKSIPKPVSRSRQVHQNATSFPMASTRHEVPGTKTQLLSSMNEPPLKARPKEVKQKPKLVITLPNANMAEIPANSMPMVASPESPTRISRVPMGSVKNPSGSSNTSKKPKPMRQLLMTDEPSTAINYARKKPVRITSSLKRMLCQSPPAIANAPTSSKYSPKLNSPDFYDYEKPRRALPQNSQMYYQYMMKKPSWINTTAKRLRFVKQPIAPVDAYPIRHSTMGSTYHIPQQPMGINPTLQQYAFRTRDFDHIAPAEYTFSSRVKPNRYMPIADNEIALINSMNRNKANQKRLYLSVDESNVNSLPSPHSNMVDKNGKVVAFRAPKPRVLTGHIQPETVIVPSVYNKKFRKLHKTALPQPPNKPLTPNSRNVVTNAKSKPRPKVTTSMATSNASCHEYKILTPTMSRITYNSNNNNSSSNHSKNNYPMPKEQSHPKKPPGRSSRK